MDGASAESDGVESYLNTYVVVMYDGVPFPGKVIDVDESEIEVKCMSRVGPNRFYWPAMEDKLWYSLDQVVSRIPEPLSATKRHVQVEPKVWADILSSIN